MSSQKVHKQMAMHMKLEKNKLYLYSSLSWRRKRATLKQSNSRHHNGPRTFQGRCCNQNHIQVLDCLLSVTHHSINFLLACFLAFYKINEGIVFFWMIFWHQNENIFSSVVSQSECPTSVQKNIIQPVVCRIAATYGHQRNPAATIWKDFATSFLIVFSKTLCPLDELVL